MPKITLIQCNPQNTHPYNPPLTKTPFVRCADTETAYLQSLEGEKLEERALTADRNKGKSKGKDGEAMYIPRKRAPKIRSLTVRAPPSPAVAYMLCE